jgi:hypothetical protein
MTFRNREIKLTTNCVHNHRAHWHACFVEPYFSGDVRVGRKLTGTGHCFTTPAALVWLLTGLARKA